MARPTHVLSPRDRDAIEAHLGAAKLQPRGVLYSVISYLKAATPAPPLEKPRRCIVCGAELSRAMWTDGTFIWPDRVDHEILEHGLWTPEHELLANHIVYKIELPKETPVAEPAVKTSNPLTGPSAVDLFGPEDTSLETTEGDELFLDFGEVLEEGVEEEPSEGKVLGDLDQLLFADPPEEASGGYTASRPRSEPTSHTSSAQRMPPPARTAAHPPEEPMDAYGLMSTDAVAIAKAYPKAGPMLANKIVSVAQHIGADPFDLANLIHFESAGTFSPSIKNPNSGATGLIQFYPGHTHRRLGKTTSELSKMSAVRQMDWVQTYFDKVRGGEDLDSTYKVAMAVFYPDAIDWQPRTRFPDIVTRHNPGIRTPHDYVGLMMRNAKLPAGSPPSAEPEDAGWLSSLGSMISSWFAPDPNDTAPAPKPKGEGAVWSAESGITARLKDRRTGKVYGPGPLPPGRYILEQKGPSGWGPATATELHLQNGHSYLLFVRGGALQWGDQG